MRRMMIVMLLIAMLLIAMIVVVSLIPTYLPTRNVGGINSNPCMSCCIPLISFI
jgi:hypothetical protein